MRLNSSSQSTTLSRPGVTLTELLVVVSIIATLTSFGFYAFSSARQFGTRQETEVGASIARVSVNSQIRRVPSAAPINPIPLPLRRAYEHQGRSIGFEKVGMCPATRLSLYGLPNSRGRTRAALDAYFTKVPIAEIAAPFHLTAAPIHGLYDTHPVGAPAIPPIWKTYDPALDTFKLHSRPGSNYTIFMDFDGHTVPGTNRWAKDYNNGNPITGLAWSMDADRTTFSVAERNKIILMWARVAEDFAPFDIDVTTEQPAAADLIFTGVGDTKWGIRVIICPRPASPGPNDWSTAGGIAFIPSFWFNSDICCWAFNGDQDPIPEDSLPGTVSHEVGHSLGLNHDGDSTKTPKTPAAEYYIGHGSGNAAWNTIMGSNVHQKILDQWSNGFYPGATNTEDDLDIITNPVVGKYHAGLSYPNGVSYRADDHHGGDLTSSPTALNAPLQGTLTTTYGIIEKNTDVDIFAIYADLGTIDIKVDPVIYAPNLDVKADLYNPSGILIASGTRPANQLYAEIKAGVPIPGVYQLRVSGTGRPGINGYPNYGSLGNYRISGTVQPMTPIVGGSGQGFRVLNPTRWTFDPASQTFSGYLSITNLGATTLAGTFKLNMTLPDPSLTVLTPTGGTQVGNVFTGSFSANLVPNLSTNILLKLQNPNRIRLPIGHNSFPVLVQQ